MFKEYKNRPMIINAVQLTEYNFESIKKEVDGQTFGLFNPYLIFKNKTYKCDLEIHIGDWLIKGSYPGDYEVKKDEVFREKYNEVVEPPKKLKEGNIKGGINEPPTTPRPPPPRPQAPFKIDLKKVGKDLVDAVRKEKKTSMGYQPTDRLDESDPPIGMSGVKQLSINEVKEMMDKEKAKVLVITPEDIERSIAMVEKYGRTISFNNKEVKKDELACNPQLMESLGKLNKGKTIPFSKYIELQVIYKTTNNLSNENVKMVIDEVLKYNNCEVE